MGKEIVILIVEDESLNTELFEVLLKRKNLSYLLAEDGLEALDMFEKHPEIDLVLLDIKIPNLNGEDVLVKMKKLRPDIPIVVQTAYVFEEDKKRFFDIGGDDYISKPINKELLYDILSRWLNIDIK
ncbi:MAG: response regulator [Bacteroidales bacterium]|nr:response regulator [Bacteroidales bacterium]RLD39119.1 MAG: response regulator [Bacteroidota bacterium]